MPNDKLPLLWICGPSGVGKSAIGWELFEQISRDNVPIGYVDIDQLGMCYPAPESDPERHAIKAGNLGSVVETFEAAGAGGVIVSGVVDEVNGVRDYVTHISQTDLTLCRLRADRNTLTARLANRGQNSDQIDAALLESDLLDQRGFSHPCIDTSGLTVSDTLQAVTEATGDWPGSGRVQRTSSGFPPFPDTPGSILWLCGTTAVGKSAVGWHIFDRIRKSGTRAAFVDLEQIGFYRSSPDPVPDRHRIKAHNLAGMWRVFHQSQAEYLVVVGQVNEADAVQTYREAFLQADLTLCRLYAGPEQLRQRIGWRAQGLGPRLAGDRLRGQSDAVQDRIAEESVTIGKQLMTREIGDFSVDTNRLSEEQAADKVIAHLD